MSAFSGKTYSATIVSTAGPCTIKLQIRS